MDDSGSPSQREMVGRVLGIVTGMGRAVGAGEEWKLVTWAMRVTGFWSGLRSWRLRAGSSVIMVVGLSEVDSVVK